MTARDSGGSAPGARQSECSLCPAWLECAHFGELCVRFAEVAMYSAHPCRKPFDSHHSILALGRYVVSGPHRLNDARETQPCDGWVGKRTPVFGAPASRGYLDLADARADFARCAALMLDAGEAAS